MRAWPEKKELKVHGHQYCHECKNVGWNEAQKECSQSAIDMLKGLKLNPGIPVELNISMTIDVLIEHNSRINALIKTIRGKM